jgi:hypothetical protein
MTLPAGCVKREHTDCVTFHDVSLQSLDRHVGERCISMSSLPLVEADLLVRQSCISEHEGVESQIELEVGLVRIQIRQFSCEA